MTRRETIQNREYPFSSVLYILAKTLRLLGDGLIPIRHATRSIQAIQTQCVLSDVNLIQY